jgi:hypothetical protein
VQRKLSLGYCKKCGKQTEGQSRGKEFCCKTCGIFTKKTDDRTSNATFTDNGYTAQYVVSSEKRITTVEEIIALCNIDVNVWRVDKFEVGVHEGYRKDRKGWWKSENGRISGATEDSGKILIVPMHSVRVWLSRKTAEIRNALIVDEFVKKAIKYSPKYKKIKYRKLKNNHLFEIGLPDLQLGRLVAAEEAGHDINPKLQIKKADDVIDRLIEYSSSFCVDRVLFPVGNDFFDTNSAAMFTAHGTPQQDDVRWKRTYQLGCDFIVRTIEKLQQIAPVDVLIIAGNHDEDKIWHLGEYVSAWNNKNPNVVIDNRPMKRKYYSYQNNLIGFTHGYFEKNDKLDSLMAYEVPFLWSASTHREWHLGDKHHKVDMVLKTNELNNGVVIRIIRSLANPSVWEFDKGLVGSTKAAEGFMWDCNDGIVAQFTAVTK